jgi:hypothetical protein
MSASTFDADTQERKGNLDIRWTGDSGGSVPPGHTGRFAAEKMEGQKWE